MVQIGDMIEQNSELKKIALICLPKIIQKDCFSNVNEMMS